MPEKLILWIDEHVEFGLYLTRVMSVDVVSDYSRQLSTCSLIARGYTDDALRAP